MRHSLILTVASFQILEIYSRNVNVLFRQDRGVARGFRGGGSYSGRVGSVRGVASSEGSIFCGGCGGDEGGGFF